MSAMSKPLVVIADPDEQYVVMLERKFLEELGDTMRMEVITDVDYLSEFLSSAHDIEALLIAEQWVDDRLDMHSIAHLFVLVEEEHEDTALTCSLFADRTYKYTSSTLIFNKVVSSSAALSEQGGDSGDARVLLFFSPVGGAGTTTAALAVATCLRETYKRVLYVNAEYVQSFGCFLRNGQMAPNGMGVEMARVSGDAYSNVKAFLCTEGFDYLPPLRSGLSAFGIEFDFFSSFVAHAAKSGDYDYVVVDTGGAFNEDKSRLLALADHVVMMVTQDARALFKVMKLLDNLENVTEDRYRFVCNKYRSAAPNAFSNESGGGSIVLDGYVEADDGIGALDACSLGSVSGFKRLAYSLA